MTRAEARRGDPGAFAAATAVMPEHSDRSRDVPRPSDIRSGVARAEELDSPELRSLRVSQKGIVAVLRGFTQAIGHMEGLICR